MALDKKRIPQAGETVYLKSDPSGNSMYLESVFHEEMVTYGRCCWTEYEMFDDELLEHDHEKVFLLSELTVYPPVKQSRING